MRNAAPEAGHIVATDGVAALVEQLDGLARRRPRRDPRLPTVIVTGPGADGFLRGYRSRLLIDGRPSVPHALVEAPGAAGPEADVAVLDQVADALGQSMPGGPRGMHGLRGLRLARYWTVRHILDATAPAATEPERRRQLRDALYARRRELGGPAGWLQPVAAWLEGVAVGPVSGTFLAKPMVAASKVLFGLRLRASQRFRWFKDEVATVTGVRRPFLGAGVRLVEGGHERPNAILVRRVLALALLHDLQAATRFSLLSPFRRRRVTPFVLLLQHVAPGSAAHRFLDTLASVTREDVRRHTLLTLATIAPAGGGGGPEATPVPPETPTYGPREAAAALAPLVERGHAPPAGVVRVELPDGPPSGPDEAWLQLHPLVQPMPVRSSVSIPLLAVLGLLALLASLVISILPDPDEPRCPEDIGGEMIGIGDGADGCSFFPDADDTATVVDDAMAAVEAQIAHENADVLARDQRYASIVLFAPLTVPPGQGRTGENALNQLRGTALAQQRANDAADGDPNRVLTRVLLANPGDRFANGVAVAEQIVERAEDDDTIIGVVGIGQSRRASREAVRLLGDSLLPVVAGPVTGDAMVESSQHYYQVSPRNRRVASMLVDFSTRTEIVRPGDGDAVVPEGAVIIMDHTDEYSANLAYNLYDLFVDTGRRVRSITTYPVEGPDAPVPDALREGAPEPTRVGSLDGLAQQVCPSLGERDIVFYASRSQQFIGMLQSMRDNNDCPDRFTVVGGSALTKIVEDPSNSLQPYQGVNLYYAAFASSSVPFSTQGDDFMRRYEATYGADVIAPDISDGAVAYDAFNALQRTADYAVRNGLPLSADTSAGALGGEQIEFDGASGLVALGNGPIDSDSPRVPPDKPVLVLDASEADPAPVLACGNLAQGRVSATWGPNDAPCPTVD